MASTSSDNLTCPKCAAPLVDGEDDGQVTVGDETFTFRRNTDWLTCPVCGAPHRATDLANPPRATSRLDGADPAVEQLRDLSS